MKFYLLQLAALAILCGLSSAMAALTQEELDREMANTECPPRQRPAQVKEKCPRGARSPLDCPPVRITCVPQAFGNDQPSTRKSVTGPTAPRKTQEELDAEMMNKECPPGQRAAQIKENCPTGANNPLDCPPVRIDCVLQAFRNDQPSTRTSVTGPTASRKTQEELDLEMMNKECPTGQRPAQVKEKCPNGANNPLDCPPVRIDCVPQAFRNDNPSTRTSASGPTASRKTQEELDAEMMNKECPAGQRPAQVKEKCPDGANNPLDCPPTEVRCVQSSFGNDQPITEAADPQKSVCKKCIYQKVYLVAQAKI